MSANRMFTILSEIQKDKETLQSKQMVRGLPEFKTESFTCVDCLNGKQTRAAIPKQRNWRASKNLELIHSDLCGPISPTSNSGKRYFLSFIDDHSRKSWVYLLGDEYTSALFNEYCAKHGIKRQYTNLYTPQQNEVSERKTRTVMNMVRSMLSAKRIPKTLWTEAVNWTFYILNRCPTFAVKDITPQEAWSGVKPSVDHLRIWGCLAHTHVPKVNRSKLDNRSTICIFLGISEGTKGYRLFNTETKRIIVSKDVLFEEEKQWEWGNYYEEQVTVELEWNDSNMSNNEAAVEEENLEGVDNVDGSSTSQSSEISTDTTNVDQVDATNTDQGRVESSQRRTHTTTSWMSDYVTGEGLSDDEEVHMVQDSTDDNPSTFNEAVQHEKWRKAMDSEINSIEKNNTWTLTELLKESKRIGVKWIFKTKRDENGEITKHKAMLVAKGYSQKEGVDYTEVYAPVARMDTVRMIIAMAAHNGWKIYQMDIKSAFLHGELLENVFVEQPQGYEKKGKEHLVYKLTKALYGLKQAPRTWYSKIETHFNKEGFKKCNSVQTLFTKRSAGGTLMIVSIYVDDLIYTRNDHELMRQFKTAMVKEFDMTDLGMMNYFLGIEVIQRSQGIFI
ncbi:transmembrane signal receptor [Lithospermum erythrorhizon]|uniref:Transmembrane signal receptor n=1 Tax=Lithospermum erythrorhizon TaxID=34254 RepID=A0AAV3PA56_LITER